MQKIPKQEYTAEFKEQAVMRAREVGVGVVSRELGPVAQTLRNWANVAAGGKLNAAVAKAVMFFNGPLTGFELRVSPRPATCTFVIFQ